MFSLPNFNLICNVWLGGETWPLPPWDTSWACALTCGRRAMPLTHPLGHDRSNVWYYPHYLLVPVGLSFRDRRAVGLVPYLVEVPSGSAHFYECQAVGMVGWGHPNEHRVIELRPVLIEHWPDPFGDGGYEP